MRGFVKTTVERREMNVLVRLGGGVHLKINTTLQLVMVGSRGSSPLTSSNKYNRTMKNERLLRYKAALLTQLLRAEAQNAVRTQGQIRARVNSINLKLVA